MERYPVDELHFSVIHALDSFARKNRLAMTSEGAQVQLFEELRTALAAHMDHKARLFGLHSQTMFAYIAAAMGGCVFISEEDAGELFCQAKDMQRPDFRMVTTSGDTLFVESKNFYQKDPIKPWRISGSYLRSLKRYAEVNSVPLYLAIYWSRWNLWSLINASHLDDSKEDISLGMGDAMLHNEMHILGDCMIRTKPPLSFRLYADRDKPRTVSADGLCEFTVSNACLCAAGIDVEDPVERRIGWYLFENGTWGESEEHNEIEDDQLVYREIRLFPRPHPEEDADREPDVFDAYPSIGFLSQMITSAYFGVTSRDGNIQNISPADGPDKFGIQIPKDYRGSALHLVRCVLLPNGSPRPGVASA